MGNTTNERLGKNIKEIRISKGLTQEYVAQQVGITRQAVCKIEKNGSANLITLERIAKALFVDIQDLYEPIPQRKPTNDTYDFITIDEKEATLHEQMLPLYKTLNDIVARRYAKMIKEQCHLSIDDIEQLLKSKGYHADTYSPKELYEICEKLNNEFILKVYDILNGVTND